jgi:Condensation domain/Phosphopantetheine attachment site
MPDILAQIISIWREVLAPAHVGPDTNFFDCGGNSLNAARLVARLVRDTRRPVRVRTVFENPSPVKLAAALSGAAGISPGPSNVAEPSDSALVPLTSQQEAIWFAECLNPAARCHSCVTTVRLPKPLEPGRLLSALQHVIDRNEALRTSVSVVDGKPVQILSETAKADLRLRGRVGADELARELRELSETPFDLASLPFIFWVLYQDAATAGSVLAQVEHHFVHEAWSARLILEQIAQAYRGAAAGQETPVGYLAFARWQRRWLDGADAARQRGYWAGLLAGDRDVVRFPHDERRPHVFSHRGATIRVTLGPHLASGLRTAGAALGATPFSMMFAAFGILIGAETGTRTLVVGTAYRNRQPPFERTVGVFANTLGIPVPQWAGRTYRDVVRDTSALLAHGHDNQAISPAAVAREMRLRPQLSRNPLYQVCLSMNDCPDRCLDFGDCEAEGTDSISGGAKLDLDVVIVPSNGMHPWHMLWRYYTEILTAAEATRLAGRYEGLLSFLVGHPDLTLPDDLLVPSHLGRREEARV